MFHARADVGSNCIPNLCKEVRFLNGSIYSGYMLDNMPHGKGVLTTANDVKYIGHFKEGFKEGRFDVVSANNTIRSAYYQNDKEVDWNLMHDELYYDSASDCEVRDNSESAPVVPVEVIETPEVKREDSSTDDGFDPTLTEYDLIFDIVDTTPIKVYEPPVVQDELAINAMEECIICRTNKKCIVYDCGHVSCAECASKINQCHSCKQFIKQRNVFHF